MGIVYTEITLVNASDLDKVEEGRIREDEVRQMTVEATVDTGARTLIINEEIRQKLGLRYRGYGEANLADGHKGEYPMTGGIEIRWKNRWFVCSALVLPDANEVLLGAIPLEALDLTINPQKKLVGVHGDIVIHRV